MSCTIGLRCSNKIYPPSPPGTSPSTRIDEQISWLGRVLASRGMPQWMLALHLEHLHHELVEAIPERRESYHKLLHAAQALHERRRAHIPDELLSQLTSDFDAQTDPQWKQRLTDAGALLAAAVADERAGIKNAVESLAEEEAG